MNFLDYFDNGTPQRVLEEYCSRAKPGADKLNYKKFKERFDSILPETRERVASQKYKFIKFEVMLKVKKHYKLPRLIFKTAMRDRLVTKLMVEYLTAYYAEQDYSPVKTRDGVLAKIADAIKMKDKKEGYRYNNYLRLDISNYFDSINRHLLIRQLRDDGCDETFIYLVEKLFYTMDLSMDRPNGSGVPQGVSISSILAERYLKEFEKKYACESSDKGICIFRYVDDILVLTADDVLHKKARQDILFELQSKYGLTINSDKISEGKLGTDEVDFLGISIASRKIAISVAQQVRVKAQLDDLFMWYRRVKMTKRHPLYGEENRALISLIERLNLLITGYRYRNSDGREGRFGWIQTSLPIKIDDVSALKALDKHVGSLIRAYIREPADQERINENRKSFYLAFYKIRYSNGKDDYVLDREGLNDEQMYKKMCDLSFVDLKYELKGDFDISKFEQVVGESIYRHFCKSLYIANRELTSDILYW